MSPADKGILIKLSQDNEYLKLSRKCLIEISNKNGWKIRFEDAKLNEVDKISFMIEKTIPGYLESFENINHEANRLEIISKRFPNYEEAETFFKKYKQSIKKFEETNIENIYALFINLAKLHKELKKLKSSETSKDLMPSGDDNSQSIRKKVDDSLENFLKITQKRIRSDSTFETAFTSFSFKLNDIAVLNKKSKEAMEKVYNFLQTPKKINFPLKIR